MRGVPDGLPHVETVQRLGATGLHPRQPRERGQPVGDVQELPTLDALPLQQRAGHEAHTADAAFPQAPLPPAQGPVVAPGQGLPTVICKTVGPWRE